MVNVQEDCRREILSENPLSLTEPINCEINNLKMLRKLSFIIRYTFWQSKVAEGWR